MIHRSRLYESAPAYVTDQPRFLNGAVVAATRLSPLQLLDQLKAIEACLQLYCEMFLAPAMGISPTGGPDPYRDLGSQKQAGR